MSKVFIEESTLSSIGDAIREKAGSKDMIAPQDMGQAILNLSAGSGTGVPEEAFNFSGSLKYTFAGSNWNWFLDEYFDKITFNNISTMDYICYTNSEITRFPFINITKPILFDNAWYGCYNLQEINMNYTGDMSSSTTHGFQYPFYNCYSLRRINGLDSWPAICKGSSIFGLYCAFYSCHTLDELINVPFIYSTYTSSDYQFSTAFNSCSRLKELTFKPSNENIVVPISNKTLDLSKNVGYCNLPSYILNYNSGITADKEVKDQDSYEALKNDPDWFSCKAEYSRYNHDSAVNTINSLPQTDGTNTIKFLGVSGSLTDGGAINTLTEEEIAVASVKGWTIAYV